jgi:putative transposase
MRILGKRTSNEEPVTISNLDWRLRTYAIGGTGTGKTTWLESLMAQDLAAGRGFCFIDEHGDSAKRIADSSPQPVIFWRPADLAFPIGPNPLQNVAPDERWRVTADIVSVFSDIWGLGTETPRLLYYLRAAVRLLLDSPGSTLLDIRRALSDERYRQRLLRKCTDQETRQTWEEFNAKDARQQTQQIGSLQNKVAALADALPLRLIIGQQTSTISIRRIIDSGTVLVVDLSGIGEEPARLLGALLVSQFAQAAEARADIEESERRDYTLYIDEFQNFASLAFAKILSEARKWHLSIGHRQLNQAWTICWQWRGMKQARDPLYRRHRFPAGVISYAVWLYFRFPLSLRMVEEMLAARGIDVSHESVRHWAEKFGREYSNRIRRRAPARGDKWHMDEVVITIRGRKHWLWRAVDQQGFVLDVLVQSRRDRAAAQRLMRKLLKKSAKAPRVMITDKLKSYGAARKDMGLRIEHRQHKGLNNRAENSHLPTRRRERIMKRFKSPRQVQKFLSIHDQVANLFHFPRNKLSAIDYRAARAQAFSIWTEIAAARPAA